MWKVDYDENVRIKEKKSEKTPKRVPEKQNKGKSKGCCLQHE